MSERERFEKYARDRSLPLDTMIDGTYYYAATYEAWAAWQAACPDGWQCVPKEPTKSMEDILQARSNEPYIAWCYALEAAPKPGEL